MDSNYKTHKYLSQRFQHGFLQYEQAPLHLVFIAVPHINITAD